MQDVISRKVRLQQLKAESERLRLEFLRSELEISYTIATFPDPHSSHRLRLTSHDAAWQGYRTALKLLSKHGPVDGQDELVAKLDLLRAVLAEDGHLSNPIHSNGTTGARNSPLNGIPVEPLTPRELEVLKCVAQGHSTKQVAGILGITFKTAACHRYRVMDKLGIHDTASLVRYAIREGIVRP